MAYEKRRFTEDQIQLASDTNLLEYAKQFFEVKKVGNNSYKIDGFGGLHINPEENKWNCFSQGKGGGAIQFVMFTENKSWVEAVKQLLGISSDLKNIRMRNHNIEIKDRPKEKILLPKKNNTYKHMMAYLIKTRKIDKGIVYKLIKEKKLYEDQYKNCVFVGHDNKGAVKYASIRGTNTNMDRFRGDVKNSDKAYSFSIEGGEGDDKIFVFESPIDAMSYLTIHKVKSNNQEFRGHVLSLGGLSDKALERYLNQYSDIKEINLCLDNDSEGIVVANRLREEYKSKFTVNIQYPTGKDYNDDLRSLATPNKKIKKEFGERDTEEEEELEL
ncbi:DUF3991 and toprim domain-containing protein [Alkaliphilus sp. B6464]|uniref:DUF3991 and toprim domain-containing protein n=1 Tax=Alkaliphilus sp. B6464 TaxID=2731219 RepID=UPI001BA8FBDE|nr:DUF3991 domain-containing protein [Alkaliphilus sp. B6464]QUH20391.1 toprim domain-containing protein [Alkaliphilus sp. B6464]